MVGNNSASVVADAYLKGARGYDINALYEALLKGANNEGPLTAVGRAGAKYYNELGYVPYDVKINENAARTLEYAYDDFTIYQLAKALNRPKKEINLYAKRSQNYRNLFDKQTGLMRGSNQDGSWQTPFNPFKWGDAFTEGNSWHYTWSVFHDVQGLMNLMGGKKPFVATLDTVFTLPPKFDESYYGSVIHEIREMQIANMGQYAHGNQPMQHMIYLYNYAGQPWKTQYWVREVHGPPLPAHARRLLRRRRQRPNLGLVRVFGPGLLPRLPRHRPVRAGRAALSKSNFTIAKRPANRHKCPPEQRDEPLRAPPDLQWPTP